MDVRGRIEVNGKTGRAIVRGFGSFTIIGSQLLLEEGIGAIGEDGLARIEPDAWYPLDAWLRVLQRIGTQFGDRVLFQIGTALVSAGTTHAPTIHEALRGLDGIYHRNHRLDGRLMFDERSGRVHEGIGHYGYEAEPDAKIIRARCDNPYPCAFDVGILTWLAQRCEPSATIAHAGHECRKNGQGACTYRIAWGR